MASAESDAFQSPTHEAATAKSHSCYVCKQRKVKCDKQDPCSSCVKSRLECVFMEPPPPRRRKRKTSDDDLHTRVKHYEELLAKYGERPATSPRASVSRAPTASSDVPASPYSSGASERNPPSQVPREVAFRSVGPKFMENPVWKDLGNALPHTKDMLQESSDEEALQPLPQASTMSAGGERLILAPKTKRMQVTAFHPSPQDAARLWSVFLDRVSPLVGVLHTPSIGKQILEAAEHPESVSRPMEALMFAVYLSAIRSLNGEDAENFMQPNPSTLYLEACQQALVNAGFLRSTSLVVLQAYVLFLLASRMHFGPQTLWIMTGIAVRIAQRIGLHAETTYQSLSAFDAEMRRRLWWLLSVLDARVAEISGTGVSAIGLYFDTKIPLNVNDSDLHPDMKHLPCERQGLTDMIYCLFRYETGNYMRHLDPSHNFGGDWQKLNDPSIPLVEKNAMIDDFENLLEQKFLRYCDPSVPLHILTSVMARSTVCKLKLRSNHPRNLPDGGATLSQDQSDMVFSVCIKMMEYENLLFTTESTQRFTWLVNSYFPMDAFVYLIGELRHRTSGPLADRAWQKIEQALKHRHFILHNRKRKLFVALGNLTLHAWDEREKDPTYRAKGEPTPSFVTGLRARDPSECARILGLAPPAGAAVDASEPRLREDRPEKTQVRILDTSMEMDAPSWLAEGQQMDFGPMDWNYWDNLALDWEMPDIPEPEPTQWLYFPK